jgi:integrase/recombinase XerC
MATPAERVAAWLEQLRIERAPSPHTLAAYRRDSAKLLDFMQARDIADFDALTPDRIARLSPNSTAPDWRHPACNGCCPLAAACSGN